MPPKSKKQKMYLDKASRARLSKGALGIDDTQQPTASGDVVTDDPSASTSSVELEGSPEPSDGSYSPTEDMQEEAGAAVEQFVEDWVLSLNHEDTISLSLFLTFHLAQLLNFTSTKAAEYAAIMVGKSDRTIRQWRADFEANKAIPDSQQGHYQRTGVLWSAKSLNTKVSKYVRENANIKGHPNLTTHSFCRWVNDELLPNEILEPGFPRRVSVETARRWLHELGFESLSSGMGIFFDGHERDDVIAARKVFLDEMAMIGFLHPDHAPTPEAARAFPTSIPLASAERREKTVVFFHNESTF